MSEVKKIATRESYGNALAELGAEFDNLVVLDADLAAATKTGIFKKAFPERHIDCGIPGKVGSFIQVERIDHVGAPVGLPNSVVQSDIQNAFLVVHLEIHPVQVHPRLEHHHRMFYCLTQQSLRGDVHCLEHIPPHKAAVVIAVDTLAG